MTSSLASASALRAFSRRGAAPPSARVRSAGRRIRRASRAPPRAALEEGPVARRADADDDDAPSRPGALSVVDSTDDVFAEFCASQVELVARALGRGARCMLYLRAPGASPGDDHLRLQEVASFPPKAAREDAAAWDDDLDPDAAADPTREPSSIFGAVDPGVIAGDALDAFDAFDAANADSFQPARANPNPNPSAWSDAAASSAAASSASASDASASARGSITLNGFGSVDDDTPSPAEALLVKQRVFALPSTNALVVPLSRDDALVGLLVGEMPEGGGWRKTRRVSARTRRERERNPALTADAPEVEVLGAADAGEEEIFEAQSVGAQFGDRRRAALAAAARAVVAAWAMHRRANYATAAAVRSDRRVAGFTYAAKEPLTVLRTLGGMLSSHLTPNTPSKDMADAMVAQGDALAELSEELESALYPREMVEELTAGMARDPRILRDGDGDEGGDAAGRRTLPGGRRGMLPAPGATRDVYDDDAEKNAALSLVGPGRKGSAVSTATSEAIATGKAPSCDLSPVVASLLASAEVMARPAGVTMTATFPEPPDEALARVDPRDARELLALVVDAALVAAPKGGEVSVVVRANGGAAGGVAVAASVAAGREGGAGVDATTRGGGGESEGLLPGALASAATAGGPGFDPESPDARGGAAAAAAQSVKGEGAAGAGAWRETQSLKIARSLVEGAGGIFHVLPSLPPAVGRVELWIPGAEEGRGGEEGEANGGGAGAAGAAGAAVAEMEAVDV